MTGYELQRILEQDGPYELAHRMRLYPSTNGTSVEPVYAGSAIASTRAEVFDATPGNTDVKGRHYWTARRASEVMDLCRRCKGKLADPGQYWTGPCLVCGGREFAFTKFGFLTADIQ